MHLNYIIKIKMSLPEEYLEPNCLKAMNEPMVGGWLDLQNTDSMFKFVFWGNIIIYGTLFARASLTFKRVLFQQTSPFLVNETICILILSFAQLTISIITLATTRQNMAWRGVQAVLSPIFYWTSDAALFLYALRIWVTAADADKRSHNLYIEKFSDLTQKQKIEALKPSVINSRKVKLTRNIFLYSLAIVIIFFNLLGAFFYPDEDDPKV